MEIFKFGSIASINDPRTITSDMVVKADGQIVELPQKGIVPLNFNYCNELTDQFSIGCCTRCAVRMAQEEWHKDGVRLDEFWGYIMQKVLYDDPTYGVHFEGSSALIALKCAHRYGSPRKVMLEKYPLKINGSYNEFWADFQKTYGGKIPKEIMKDAESHKIAGYYQVNLDPESLAREINAGKVMAIRMSVGKNFYTDINEKPSMKTKDLMPLRAPRVIQSGHLMAMNGYDKLTEEQELSGPNSWGTRWCRDGNKYGSGYYWFNLNIQRPFFTEAWALMDTAPKFVFDRQFGEGSMGPDVTAIQKILESEGLLVMPKDVSYGFFGKLTKKGVILYQEKYADDILKPVGLKKGTGFVGSMTLKHLNNR